ncbi:MAG TPA: glycosyltransferase [Candidatus Cybelea sp.]|nr:glycosyltransferase [Candidatus Cybelea sp.]
MHPEATTAATGTGSTPALTVVVKTLNEAEKIAACLRSVLAATDPSTTEIIVADSLSDDDTVAIAARYPVEIVQLARREDRGCGSAAQLGFQYARGERLLLLDGDMELAPDFLAAAHGALDADPKLAGVGGLVVDRVLTLEFQRRNQNVPRNSQPGTHGHLNGGGLFRMAALRQSGYLTDRNLHACEELELGMRLSALGWHFRRLDLPSVYHYGHATPPFRLLLARWRTKYLFGQGELLRAKLGTPQWERSLKAADLYFAVIAWWAMLLTALLGFAATRGSTGWGIALLAILAVPFMLQCWRKRSFVMGVYSMALLNFHAAGMIAGLLRRRVDPMQRIDSVVRHSAQRAQDERSDAVAVAESP